MKITYVFHSCYIVETQKAVFVFDYYKGDVTQLPKNKPIYFFASHGHFDHCGKKVFELGKQGMKSKYIFTADIKLKPPILDELVYIEENQSYELDGIIFHTFHSTDLGVAYLVETDEGVIYHAGDLNWWHWNGESKEYNRKMEDDYKQEISRIAEIMSRRNLKIEVAFLPLDQRQENAYDWGMKYFMKHLNVSRVMPMHFFSENFDICQKVVDENEQFRDYDCEFVKIERLGQEF